MPVRFRPQPPLFVVKTLDALSDRKGLASTIEIKGIKVLNESPLPRCEIEVDDGHDVQVSREAGRR